MSVAMEVTSWMSVTGVMARTSAVILKPSGVAGSENTSCTVSNTDEMCCTLSFFLT